jgi:hypothetical protein
LIALACETLIGAEFDDVRRRSGPKLDAGADVDAGFDGPSCDPIEPPGPPSVQNAPGDVTLTNVITTVDYGDAQGTKAYLEIGYDLDGRCTNRGDPPECLPEAWTEGDPTDGPRGQDNGVGKLLAIQYDLFGVAPITSETESAEIKKGKRAPFALLRVSGFSGFSEDDEVRVEWYSALRFDQAQGPPAPKLDGNDAWPVAAFVADLDAGAADAGASPSVHVDPAAYVTHSTLVARFPMLKVPLANVWFEVRDVVLTAKLTPEPGGGFLKLYDGTIAGRARMDELLWVVPYITKSLLGLELCTDNPNYATAKSYVCSAADIPFGSTPPANGVCDGISFGLNFQTDAAQLGPTISVPPPALMCELAKDPSSDTCANGDLSR